MQRSLLSISGIFLLAGILILVNGISQAALGRYYLDLTQEGLYSLSEGSEGIIDQIKDPITIRYYFSRTDSARYPSFRLYGNRVKDLLESYRRAGRRKIKLEIFDPRTDSEDEDWAQKYGLTPIPTEGGEKLFLGLTILNSSGTELSIPIFNLNRQELLEYDITKLIYSLVNTHKPVVGIISSLDIEGKKSAGDGGPPGQPGGVPWFFLNQIQQTSQVRVLEENTSTLGEGIDVLVLIHPKKLNDQLLYQIDQFVLRGGKLLVLIDPWCQSDEVESDPKNPLSVVMADRGSDLFSLLNNWGVKLARQRVVGDIELATKINTGAGGPFQSFVLWLSIARANMSSTDFITGALETMVLPWPGALEIKAPKGVSIEPILSSTKAAHLLEPREFQFGGGDPEALLSHYVSDGREYVLAARIRGKLTTNFPGGPPNPNEAEKEPMTPVIGGPGHLAGSTGLSNVIVVADADFINDRFSVATQNAFGTRMYQLLNDNVAFFQNAVENLSGSNDLIGIRSRGRFTRPFTRVKAIEARAEEKWQAEEQRLEAKLTEANKRLAELQSGRGASAESGEGSERLTSAQVFNDAVRGEIQWFREERREAQSRLREVRRHLRQDKERLGEQLFVLNTFLVPILLVIVSTLMFYLRRRKKRWIRA